MLAAIYLVTKHTVVEIGPSIGPFLQQSLSESLIKKRRKIRIDGERR
jgi:hypothetical protein